MKYKHTQIGYLMVIIWFTVFVLFTWMYITSSMEPPSVDSGPNLAITTLMTLILVVLGSFTTLQVTMHDGILHIKFGYGIYQKKFALEEIKSAKAVKNHWFYGWGIRVWLWPRMVIYNISGFDAVEITLKNNEVYRIGTDEPKKLEQVIAKVINSK